jgi:hypothetical protein
MCNDRPPSNSYRRRAYFQHDVKPLYTPCSQIAQPVQKPDLREPERPLDEGSNTEP